MPGLRLDRSIALAALVLFSCVPNLSADVKIVLKDSFIEDYKHRTTMDACFFIEHAKDSANSPSEDGDLHIAGHATAIGLSSVAEIMNAKFEETAVELANASEGSDCVPIIGAWRIWCEHGGNEIHSQFVPVPAAHNTNPHHIFEIHPVTHIGPIDMPDSLRPIIGFDTKDAFDSFREYENKFCQIEHDDAKGATIIRTRGAGYNYPEFIMEITDESPKIVDDGRFVFASVFTLEGELIVHKVRTVFIKGTRPETLVREKGMGARLHVLGIPRVNLALVAWRVKKAAEQHDSDPTNDDPLYDDVLNWSLPYEIIIVGVYDD